MTDMNNLMIALPPSAVPFTTGTLIYADGVCLGNPGVGGYAATVRRYVTGALVERRVVSDADPGTTNNRMELTAAIEALRATEANREQPVILRSDSEYVVKGMNEWRAGWIAKGWKKVKNRDLWEALIAEADKRAVTFEWVRGHAGDPGNEEVDRLAAAAAARWQVKVAA